MGIKDLLKRLRHITREISLEECKGQVMAVDASCILHRCVVSSPREHTLDTEDSNLISSCMRQITYLRRDGIEPIVVFDGAQLPMKENEEGKRNRMREESFKKACELEAAGDFDTAKKHWQAAAAIKPHHVKRLIEALKAEPRPFRFIVAPYEADAQCAYLALSGRVDAVITEDSDLLCYGCPRVLFKTDFFLGTAEEIRLEDLAKNDKPSFIGWDVDLFQELCVLSGCDFLDNISKRAIMTVHKGLIEQRSGLQYIRWLRTVPGVEVPPNYELSFLRARATFRHQVVYCPDREECLHITPIPEEGLRIEETVGFLVDLLQVTPQEQSCDTNSSVQSSPSSSSQGLISSSSSSSSADNIGSGSAFKKECGLGRLEDDPLGFLGPKLPPDVASAVARGDLDARTKQPFSASTLTPSFTPELAREMGLRGAAEVRELTTSACAPAGCESFPSLWLGPPSRPTPLFRVIRRTRGVSPAALPCLPLQHRSSSTTNLSTTSSSTCHISSSKSNSRLGARPMTGLGQSLVRNAPMLLRKVFV